MSLIRRLPGLALLVLAGAIALQAAPPLPVPTVSGKPGASKQSDDVDPKAKIDEAAGQQERLRRQFEEFKQALLRLKQRLESSAKQEDKDKARVLNDALTRASEQGTDNKFNTLVGALRGSDVFKDLDQLQTILDRNEDLRKDIRMLIELLLKDDRDAQLKADIERYTKMLERLKEVIAKQEKTRTQTEMGRKKAEELGKLQKKVTEETKDLIAKKSDGKSGEPKESKPGESKPGEPKPGEPKPGESKPGEPKPGQPKPGEPKPGQPKPGEPKPGDPPPPSEQKPAENNPIKKQIEEAQKSQKEAEKELEKKKNPDAVAKQDKALEELQKAKKELERLLKQLREEEIERTLAQLQARCERMLAMQIAVRDGTVAVDKSIENHQPSREQQQTSNELSDKEEEIVREASKTLGIIQAEGSAVAFAEVCLQVRGDMMNVATRLRKTDVAVVTQTIENDIIATLQEMIEALKKARKENANNKPPPPPSQSGPPPDPGLIDKIAELKMIRSMQLRVNNRTEVYGRQYDGEQAPQPASAIEAKVREHYEMIQRELRELADRQLKIGKVTNDIAKGKNKGN